MKMGKPYYPDYSSLDESNYPVEAKKEHLPQAKKKKEDTSFRDVAPVIKDSDLLRAYGLADALLTKSYISHLNQYPVVPLAKELANLPLGKNVRLFQVERIVYTKQEDNQEKLMNVYHALHACGGTAVLLVKSDGQQADFYLGVRADKVATLTMSKDVLQKTLQGNFPGTKITGPLKNQNMETVVHQAFQLNGGHRAIAAVTGIPAFRKENGQRKEFVQGMERLVDAMRGEVYSLVIVAEPISGDELTVVRRSYENLYTQLAPLAQLELTLGKNESQAVSDTLTQGISHGISQSLAYMSAVAQGHSTAHTDSSSHTDSRATTKSIGIGIGGSSGFTSPNAASLAAGALGPIGRAIGSVAFPGLGTIAGMAVGTALGAGLGILAGGASSLGGLFNIGFGYGKTKGTADTTGQADTASSSTTHSAGKTTTQGTTYTTSRSQSRGTTDTTGTSQGQQLHFLNKTIQGLLKQIERQLDRLDACSDVGLWNCAAYVVAGDAQTSQVIASTYQSLLRGDDSGTETGAVTVWQPGQEEAAVEAYLHKFRHPLLELDSKFAQVVTPATYISGKELTIAAGFPQKSIPGLPIASYVPFGREVIWQNDAPAETARLGNIYHMGEKDEGNPVKLSLPALTAHTFVTGSTGVGKSNAVYELLGSLQMHNVPWLVIEPAKGEYKDVFGGYKKAAVYGTNPYKYPNLLQLNPFSFPDDIHVLEHIDRLVEIFNACWPMYAAMPAILHEAMERAYEACGWNLKLSRNPGRFPDFATLLEILPQVIDSSAYSADTTNDYKGALVTRVRSLTRGIHGLIFQGDADLEKMLHENAIVDLSRIGSQETKALLMGILVLKLQEYRMSENAGANNTLRHLTVLEEAHNLLKKTSDLQTQESANVQGQSVAMLANAIAEMRTYGEGFVIVDQSPGLLDPSVIRNTNTKIALRLPDKDDRDLVGKAAALDDEQIEELADLERGVAAIYQSGWEEAVLCKIDKFTAAKPMPKVPVASWQDEDLLAKQKFIRQILLGGQKFSQKEIELLHRWKLSLNLSPAAATAFLDALTGNLVQTNKIVILLSYLLKLRSLSLSEQIVSEAGKRLVYSYGFAADDKLVKTAERFFKTFFLKDK